jgi:hypothetical protein
MISMAESYQVKPDQREVVPEGQDSPLPRVHPGTSGTDWVMVSLLLMCILLRVITWTVCLPTNRHADSEEYAALAYRFMTHDFRKYSADRTPVYSFLLLATKFDYRAVWFIQNILGIATSLLLYALAKEQTRKRGLAFLAGASNSIFLNQLMFEPFVMTETLAAFFLVLTLFLSHRFCRDCDPGQGASHALLLHLGVVLGLAALLRPLFVYLPIVFGAYVWAESAETKSRLRQRVPLVARVVLPALLLVLGWSAFNYVQAGYFGLTALGGYSLTNHSGAFMELAPDRYATIRDLYLHYRKIQIAAIGNNTGTIWKAYPYILQATGYSYVQLSRELTRLSLWLFVHHPLLYFRHVGLSLRRFWTPVFYQPTLRTNAASVKAGLVMIWSVQGPFLNCVYFVFFAATLHSLFPFLTHKPRRSVKFLYLPMALIVSGCLVQALVEFGENGRYAIPYQSLLILVICNWLVAEFRGGKRMAKKVLE